MAAQARPRRRSLLRKSPCRSAMNPLFVGTSSPHLLLCVLFIPLPSRDVRYGCVCYVDLLSLARGSGAVISVIVLDVVS